MPIEEFDRFEQFDLYGQWWIPGHEDDAIGGVISYDPEDGTSLRLTDAFPQEDDPFQFSPDLVFGRTEEGPATLRNCHFSQGTGPGFPPDEILTTREYKIREFYLGSRINFEDNPTVEEMRFTFTNFEEWLNVDPFEYELGDEDVDFDERLTWQFPEPNEFEIEEIEAQARLEHLFSGAGLPQYRTAEWSRKATLRLSPEEPQPPSYFFDFGSKLQTLLTIAIRTPVYIQALQIPRQLEDGEILQNRVLVFRPPRRGHPPEGVQPFGMWYHLGDDGPNLAEIIQTWFEAQQWCENASELLYGVLRKDGMFLQNRLLLLMQSLESYHREREGGRYLDEDDYEEVEETLTEAIPGFVDQGLRDSLESRIEYGYQYSLRKRLDDCLEMLDDDLVNELFDNAGGFMDDVVQTRHYYTHYDEEIERLEPEELARNLPILEDFVSVLLLSDAGVPQELLVDRVDQVRQFNP